MIDNGRPRFTVKQRRFFEALMVAESVRDAARVAKIGEATAYRIIKMPHFLARWEALRAESCALALSLAQREMVATVEALISVRDDPRASSASRVSAASKLHDIALDAAREEAAERRCHALRRDLEEVKGLNGEEGLPALPARREER